MVENLPDEVAMFDHVLAPDDIKSIMDGLEGFMPVEPQTKLTTTWGKLAIPRILEHLSYRALSALPSMMSHPSNSTRCTAISCSRE